MEKNSKSKSLASLLKLYEQEGIIPLRYLRSIETFYAGYLDAAIEEPQERIEKIFVTLLHLVKEQCLHPFSFQPFHKLIRSPFDYYQFGIDLIRPLVDFPRSSVHRLDELQKITALLEKGDNIIFLANHQTEADPQALSILLEPTHPKLGEEMIFVAGERVITDPLAVPASQGRNLLCIYSKRYIDHPPEDKEKKQQHNKRTMQIMSELLSEGGKAIYVAPSGGRDRPNASGAIEVAPYDPQSIEMFYLMAKKSTHPTHFYPMALKTYDLLPPPETIQVELGEERIAKRAAIHLAFGSEIDMEKFPGSDAEDKHERRAARATYIHDLVSKDYALFP